MWHSAKLGFNDMKVSIIIPAYNAENTVKEAIDSALSQEFPKQDFEIIVVNDGSTDKTLKLLKTYGRKIRIIDQKNQGAVRAANCGFKKARGKYVIKLDADDWFDSDIVGQMTSVLDKKAEIDFVYCDYYEASEKGEVKIVLTGDNIFHTASAGIMFRRRNFKKEGFYREDIGFPEYDLLIRTQKKWCGFHIQKPLFCYNRRKNSLTGSKQWVKKAIKELKKIHPQNLKEIKKIRKY